MKKIGYPVLLTLVTLFMLFIYEPIIMYAGNIDDFWFDLYMILPSLFLIILVITIITGLIYYLLLKKVNNKNIFNIVLIVHFIIFFILYIHGNYMVKDLNILDGSTIKFSIVNIMSSIIFILLIIGLVIIGIKKYGLVNVIDISKYIVGIVFIMLCSATIVTLSTTPKVLEKKEHIGIATNKDFNKYSTDKNFIIFVMDEINSQEFYTAISNSEYINTFENFTYYPDTIATYDNTANSVPFILTGIWNKNTELFDDYSKKAYKKSYLFNELKTNNYDLSMYEEDFKMDYEEEKEMSNIVHVKRTINPFLFFKEEIKYINYKYLPYFLKPLVDINSFKLSADRLGSHNLENKKEDYYNYYNKDVYNSIVNNKIDSTDKKQFKFIHMEGAHLPFNMDEDLNLIGTGTYEQKIIASIKVFDAFVDRLKENNMYDNSIIILLADHGLTELATDLGRQNPIFLVKGMNEHHDFSISDKPISYADLNELYKDLLNEKQGEELFSNISNERERIHLHYKDPMDKTLVEYVQTGKAWDLTTLTKTGKEYKQHKGNENAN